MDESRTPSRTPNPMAQNHRRADPAGSQGRQAVPVTLGDWAAAVLRLLERARASRHYGRITIELFDGEVTRLEVVRTAINPRDIAPDGE